MREAVHAGARRARATIHGVIPVASVRMRPSARWRVTIGVGVMLASSLGCARLVQGHHAEIHGFRMYYEVRGHGPPLLLLHGGGGGGWQFDKQVPAFAPTHRLVIPDACAQGRSTDRPGPLSYHAMAEDVATLMDHLHIRSADVMGWSDGAIVGLDLAIHHPERVRHLVTFGANFSPDGLVPSFAEWVRSASHTDFGPAARQNYQLTSPEPRDFDRTMDKILEMWRTQPNFTFSDLHGIRAKTLIAAGENDIIRREHTEQLAHSIPGAELWIVPGAGHGAIQEQPDLVNHRILEFLSH